VAVSKRSRIRGFGGAGVLVVGGIVCGIAIGGGLGQVLALVLIGIGLVVAVSLVFYEVGLSEDHERAREERARAAAEAPGTRASRRRANPVRRLARLRGERRRLP
jgi:hypothetical protein